MAFYIKPPRGTIPLHLLQKCVEERLKFFKILTPDVPCTASHSIECLFEDSALDRAGHFTLRLAALRDDHFKHFFLKCEVILFQLRLETYSNPNLLRRLLSTFLRHTRECIDEIKCGSKITQFFKTCEAVFNQMLSRNFRLHILEDPHLGHFCEKLVIAVPFQHCLSLLTTYSYELVNGYLKIPCSQWKPLLVSLYETYLQIALREMKYSNSVIRTLADSRIQLIFSIIASYGYLYKSPSVTLKDTKLEIKYFPLCIQHLQGILHKTHRLAHEERFNMSLFLKDVGMSMHDSILYWKSEYLKDTTCTKCTHSWQQDERRYVYSIRHLYGLEGSRRAYHSRSCSYFQQMVLTPMQEGGCPFKHFASAKLKLLITCAFDLCDLEYINTDDIFIERLKSPMQACKLFSKSLCDALNKPKSICDISFSSPVQYYAMLKSL